MLPTLLFLACIGQTSAAEGQDRTKAIRSFTQDGGSVSVWAWSGPGGYHNVEVSARRFADRVLAVLSTSDVRLWADSAKILIAAKIEVAKGEVVKHEMPYIGGFNELSFRGNHVRITRLSVPGSISFNLLVADEHFVNTVTMRLTKASALAFVQSLLTAARESEIMAASDSAKTARPIYERLGSDTVASSRSTYRTSSGQIRLRAVERLQSPACATGVSCRPIQLDRS